MPPHLLDGKDLQLEALQVHQALKVQHEGAGPSAGSVAGALEHAAQRGGAGGAQVLRAGRGRGGEQGAGGAGREVRHQVRGRAAARRVRAAASTLLWEKLLSC